MRLTIKVAPAIFAIGLCLARVAWSQTPEPLPTADEVVARMMRADDERKSELTGYTALRRYEAVNSTRHAELEVRLESAPDGSKSFTIISETGSSAIRKHVLYKILSEEREASKRESRTSTRIIPANYKFEVVGLETLDSGPAYVLSVTPKTENKYFIDGKVWVDANAYAIVRIEGRPARNPSFWVHNVHFVHTYQRVGQFWLASSTRTTSEVRIFGPSELTIDNSGYVLDPPTRRATATDPIASLTR
ncbi:outer membrane lipoprotein-sorting protein [Occallatibacter riparius]|uniref:Outer membrane lipoprotein-sorting protein n=1 Tax=Occallatibacter riparius TaxID=1002689 RepID=A0A9J7BTX4_9BACT|nr:outer membrane lipoprotein-sorting protein [Occallatibacter riparius]UWZ85194.1 outer membrane lipoprotein-sorting protein [Occallatibacter riparius]